VSEKGFRVEVIVHIKQRAPKVAQQESSRHNEWGDVPRVAPLLALAHKWNALVQHGDVQDYAAIARANGMTKGRVTQICHLGLLAPDIQEALLGSDEIPTTNSERGLRPIAAFTSWTEQREAWRNRRSLTTTPPGGRSLPPRLANPVR